MSTTAALTAEEKKILMKALWASLQAPTWTKDNLIDFGKAIHSKKSLKELDDKVFDKIFPFLEKVTITLSEKLHAAATAAMAKPEEPPAALATPTPPANPPMPAETPVEETVNEAGALENV